MADLSQVSSDDSLEGDRWGSMLFASSWPKVCRQAAPFPRNTLQPRFHAGLTNPGPTALAAGVESNANRLVGPEASAYGSRGKTFSSAHFYAGQLLGFTWQQVVLLKKRGGPSPALPMGILAVGYDALSRKRITEC